jgi:hypothetical protein
MPVDFNFMVGGEAGQGVQSVGFLLFQRTGLGRQVKQFTPKGQRLWRSGICASIFAKS